MIKKNEKGKDESVYAIEYKLPHKLGPIYVRTGLQGQIRPAEYTIDKSDGDFVYCTKRVVTAVFTQLFSNMTHTHVKHGYVGTSEVIIVLDILNDPTTVNNSVCIPKDQDENDPNFLYETVPPHVLAFILHALAAKSPEQSWHDAESIQINVWMSAQGF